MEIGELSNDSIRKRIVATLRFWAEFFPEEYAATKRYADKRRESLASFHGVEGLSNQGGILAWGFCPGTVHNILSQLLPMGWDVDKRTLSLFYGEFQLGALNRTTGANLDRQRVISTAD